MRFRSCIIRLFGISVICLLGRIIRLLMPVIDYRYSSSLFFSFLARATTVLICVMLQALKDTFLLCTTEFDVEGAASKL